MSRGVAEATGKSDDHHQADLYRHPVVLGPYVEECANPRKLTVIYSHHNVVWSAFCMYFPWQAQVGYAACHLSQRHHVTTRFTASLKHKHKTQTQTQTRGNAATKPKKPFFRGFIISMDFSCNVHYIHTYIRTYRHTDIHTYRVVHCAWIEKWASPNSIQHPCLKNTVVLGSKQKKRWQIIYSSDNSQSFRLSQLCESNNKT